MALAGCSAAGSADDRKPRALWRRGTVAVVVTEGCFVVGVELLQALGGRAAGCFLQVDVLQGLLAQVISCGGGLGSSSALGLVDGDTAG